MRNTLIVATFVASVLAIFAAIDVFAQGRPAPAQSPVAVVDMNYIFKKHEGLSQAEARWKQDMQAAEANVKKDKERLTTMAEKLKTYRTGTPDYKKLEEEMTALSVQLQTHIQIQKKEFGERKAKLFYAVYSEVHDAVKYWSDRNGVNLVLQFSGDPVDPNNPNSIANQLSSLVVYNHRSIDITGIILDEIAHNPKGVAPGATKPGKSNLH